MKLASLCFNLYFLIMILAVKALFSKGYNALYDLLLLIWNWFKILDSSAKAKKCGCVHIDGDTTLAIISKLWHHFQLTLKIFIQLY